MFWQELSADEPLPFGIKPHPGYKGVFTTQCVDGAIKNGARIQKAAGDPDSPYPIGSLGVVLGSVTHPELGIAYFIEWDHHPKCAMLTMAWKIEQVKL